MRQLFDLIEKLAEDDLSTVLIQGESGTGKELRPRPSTATAPRRQQPAIAPPSPTTSWRASCSATPRGAFTGATGTKIGRIEYANGGSFLDEIGDMKPTLQAKLLRVLQEREFEPVGGAQADPGGRASSPPLHRNLEEMVAEGASARTSTTG